MRIGVTLGIGARQENTVAGLAERIGEMEARGFTSAWIPNAMRMDAMTALAVAGSQTARIELGTAVVPTFPRHPVTMAQQALTTQAAAGGRFALGIGLSHRVTIEEGYGLDFGRPARHMREYLSVMNPLLRGEAAEVKGDIYRVEASLMVPDAPSPPPVLVAALGPAMLRIAGSMADGTVTSWVGPKTLETHIIPAIRKAAQEAGRPEPRICVGLPISVTNEDTHALKERYAPAVAGYNELPSYRSMMDIEGVSGPAELAMFGDESALDAALGRLRDIGVTDYLAQVAPTGEGSVERTYTYLASKL